jgi:hypothetical protein
MIKCGNCRESHETAAEVRSCYGFAVSNHTKPGDREPAWRGEPATPGQYTFLKVLRAELDAEPMNTGQLTKGQATDEIKALKSQKEARKAEARESRHSGDPAWQSADGDPEGYGDPQHIGHGSGVESSPVPGARTTATARPKASEWEDIPAGWYATAGHANAEFDFWQVDTPEEGRWAGYIFVKRIIGGQPPRRIRREEQAGALEAIRAAGAMEAMKLFGQKLGKCGKCHRALTRKASRELGIGPDCAGQVGMGGIWSALDKQYGGK